MADVGVQAVDSFRSQATSRSQVATMWPKTPNINHIDNISEA